MLSRAFKESRLYYSKESFRKLGLRLS